MTIAEAVKEYFSVQVLKDLVDEQTKLGVEKYGQTLDDNDRTKEERARHLIQECIDAVQYLEWLKRVVNPNDIYSQHLIKRGMLEIASLADNTYKAHAAQYDTAQQLNEKEQKTITLEVPNLKFRWSQIGLFIEQIYADYDVYVSLINYGDRWSAQTIGNYFDGEGVDFWKDYEDPIELLMNIFEKVKEAHEEFQKLKSAVSYNVSYTPNYETQAPPIGTRYFVPEPLFRAYGQIDNQLLATPFEKGFIWKGDILDHFYLKRNAVYLKAEDAHQAALICLKAWGVDTDKIDYTPLQKPLQKPL